MIEGIRILNFQGFKGDQRIELGDVNLLFGPNSAGKSSIARGLQLMSQSLKAYDSESKILRPVFDGNQINSRLETLIFGRGLDPSLEFGFGVLVETPVHEKVWFSIVLGPDGQVINQYEFLTVRNEHLPSAKFDVRLDAGDDNRHLVEFGPESEVGLIDWFRNFYDPAGLIKAVSSNFFIDLDAYYKAVHPSLHRAILDFCGEDIFLKSEESHDDHGTFQTAIAEFYEAAVEDFDHIPEYILEDYGSFSPSEILFKRFMTFVIDETLSSALSSLLDLEIVDPIRVIPDDYNGLDVFEQSTIEAISADLSYLTEGRYSVDQVEYLIQDQIEHRWEVQDHFTGVNSGLENVGQGITQILEVLIVLELAEGLIVLQQPDLHLHPKAVGRLADLMFRKISGDLLSSKRLLVETHSESLLMRLQKHLRLSSEHTDLGSSDISLRVFYSEAIPPVEISQDLIQEFIDVSAPIEFIDQLSNRLHEQLDVLGMDFSQMSAAPSIETRVLLCASLGYNQISALRVDHLGDVIDPFPVSFADLRVQDLLQ